ncbi:MAG TPA: hypothetical protein VI698_05800 [Nitrososphaerales archaeon]|nr:hypothetical protein [Nitrososphaerales archaeon]
MFKLKLFKLASTTSAAASIGMGAAILTLALSMAEASRSMV